MPFASRRTLSLLAAALVATACGGKSGSNDAAATAAAPAPVLPPFQQEIASIKAEVTLPGVWKYGYRLVDKADTTLGSTRAIEFSYAVDSASKLPPRLLMVIRVFPKAVWDKVAARQPAVVTKLGEHGTDVFAYSIIGSNPYPANTPAALRVDQMMLALIAEGAPFKIDFK